MNPGKCAVGDASPSAYFWWKYQKGRLQETRSPILTSSLDLLRELGILFYDLTRVDVNLGNSSFSQ